MTTKELAALLNERQYGQEITEEESELAKKNRMVVVFCHSDDCIELRGAFCAELDALWTKTTFYVLWNQLFTESEYVSENTAEGYPITYVYRRRGKPCWRFETQIPHNSFCIMDGNDPFCIGFVFCLDDLQEDGKETQNE